MSDRHSPDDLLPALAPPRTVLVVEADPVLRQFLRRLLDRHGFDVLLAAAPDQALLLVTRAAAQVGVIVHGDDLLHGESRRLMVRCASLDPNKPVVTYSGRSVGAGTAEVVLGNGVGTPFDGDKLVRAIERALKPAAR